MNVKSWIAGRVLRDYSGTPRFGTWLTSVAHWFEDEDPDDKAFNPVEPVMRAPGANFVVSVNTGEWKGDRLIRIVLLPESGEVAFCWLPSGVCWKCLVNDLLSMMESTGFVDPFKGEAGPEGPLSHDILRPDVVDSYLLDVGFDQADAPAEGR
jgi:hypothetical protein